MIRDDRSTPKTPRWWSVAPPTPAEAPQAKRRTAARSRGSMALVFVAAAGLAVAALILLFRVGRQVGGFEPAVVSLVSSIPAVQPTRPPETPSPPDSTWGSIAANDAGTPAAASSQGIPKVAPNHGKAGPARRAPRDVFRKPGF